ncbi:MAG TPA: hypothetical protein IAD39_12430 [Candidatus Merdisoma faecalis]|nr:hypothetical protein [Candidatus Merdisoma faecalis]
MDIYWADDDYLYTVTGIAFYENAEAEEKMREGLDVIWETTELVPSDKWTMPQARTGE